MNIPAACALVMLGCLGIEFEDIEFLHQVPGIYR